MRHSCKVNLRLATLPWLLLACWPASQADALPDAQGWNGKGWYVTGSAPLATTSPATTSPATPAYILFNGPYTSGSECTLVYDRLYSPIGVCRLLDIKPGT